MLDQTMPKHGWKEFHTLQCMVILNSGRYKIKETFRETQGKYIPVDNRAQHQKLMFRQLSTNGASQRLKSF